MFVLLHSYIGNQLFLQREFRDLGRSNAKPQIRKITILKNPKNQRTLRNEIKLAAASRSEQKLGCEVLVAGLETNTIFF